MFRAGFSSQTFAALRPSAATCRARTWTFFSAAWILSCKEIIENQHGIINKYLGDGFLAYWPRSRLRVRRRLRR